MSANHIAPRTERAFVTPEGVDLRLNIGDAGQRAGAFLLDAAVIIGVLIVFTIASAFAFGASASVAGVTGAEMLSLIHI